MSKQKLILGIGSLCFLILLIIAYGIDGTLGIETAYAQVNDTIRDLEGTLSGIFAFILTFLTWLTWLVFMFLNEFLDPTIIFALDGSGGGPLKLLLNDLWRLSRDLMNVIFAVALIVVAIYVVVTADRGKEFVKTYLPKFVLSVILVNFSWFACFAILDLAHVLTATVYQIPGLIVTNPKVCRDGQLQNYQMVYNLQFFLSDPEKIKLTGSLPPPNDKIPRPKGNGWDCTMVFVCFKMTTINDLSQVAPHNAILQGLVINHARLASLLDIPPPDRVNDHFVAVLFFLLRELMVIIIAGALVFPLLAMVVAFFIRIPVLWMTIAFMPFVFLTFIGGEKLEQFAGGGMSPKKIWDVFLKFAFLPALVAIPLAVGFILINAGAQLHCGKQAAGGVAGRLGAINLPILSQISDPYQLLWLIMTLLILWNGVFMILKNTEFVKGAATFIERKGLDLGKFLLKAPLAAPILPGPIDPSTGKVAKDPITGKEKRQSLYQMRGFFDPSVYNSTLDSHGVLDEGFFARVAKQDGGNSGDVRRLGEGIRNDPRARPIRDAADAVRADPRRPENITKLMESLNFLARQLRLTTTIDRNNLVSILEQLKNQNVPGIDQPLIDAIKPPASPPGPDLKKPAEKK